MFERKYIKLIRLAVAVVMAVMLVQVYSQAQVHTIDKSFDVEPGGTLQINIRAGDIVVRGWEYNEVRVEAEVYGTARTLDNLELRLEQDGNDIVIRTRHAGRHSLRSMRGRHRAERIVFTIHVPYHYHVRTDIGAGRVDVDDLDGSVRVHSGAGSSTITNIYGTIDVNTGTGSITVSLLDNPEKVNLKTATGSIKIHVPEDINAQFSLNTAVGRVRSTLDHFKSSGSRMNFSYNEGGELIHATTAVGSITVQSH